jgi:hypothetical protein
MFLLHAMPTRYDSCGAGPDLISCLRTWQNMWPLLLAMSQPSCLIDRGHALPQYHLISSSCPQRYVAMQNGAASGGVAGFSPSLTVNWF